MLRVNAGLSRKLSRDYNSTGYSINVEGEVCVPLDDPERLLDKIRELYDLADESLRDQIERDASLAAIAAHDAPAEPAPPARRFANANRITPLNRVAAPLAAPLPMAPPAAPTAAPAAAGEAEPAATNKQVQFLLSIGKRQGLSTPQLETRVAEVLGRAVGLYDLTKREAGMVLDRLTAEATARP